MKSIYLSILFTFSLQSFATASPIQAFVETYQIQSELTRASQAFGICNQLFQSPADQYTSSLLEMGREWETKPDAAYFLISTCQVMWTSRYLDPLKSSQIERQINGSAAAYKLAQMDILGSARALRAQIRLYREVPSGPQANGPAAPYEVLTGMASSERELSESLSMQTQLAVTSLVATGTVGIELLTRARAFAQATATASGLAAGVGAEPALIALVVSLGATRLSEYGVYWYRENQLWKPVKSLIKAIRQHSTDKPLPILLDEFYRATERLGYFYSYDLYLSESGKAGLIEGNQKCMAGLKAFFDGVPDVKFAWNFEHGYFCKDAAEVWASASQWLTTQYPDDATARAVADRLMARSKRTFWSFMETEKWKKQNPDCGFIWNLIGCAR